MSEEQEPLNVLYLDDDQMALTLTQLQLLKAGIHTEATSDALEAVSILATEHIDMVLLDSVMPNINGTEFLQLMKSLHLETPVVFFTGHAQDELEQSIAEFHVLKVLDKQKHRFTLPEELKALHAEHGKRPLSYSSALD